ncbi:hypothetical protein [Lederbergia citri]|uniref:Uncharacterized protein n=1 Tax=Lederbergia citri TaxID=2833580 RepID=A0A942TDM0_9BACI|nr:hypothetical protein [Lederbergia citri]MBS4195758.1 hypothetical protein [Lederbergia citri]
MDKRSLQPTFEEISTLLVRFSNQIKGIRKMLYSLTVNLSDSVPDSWNRFNDYFNMGTYFHLRCQGFVECLLFTSAYSTTSIVIWVHESVKPAAYNFMRAMGIMNEIKKTPEFLKSNYFSDLEERLSALHQTGMLIFEYSNYIDQGLQCINKTSLVVEQWIAFHTLQEKNDCLWTPSRRGG